MFEAMTEIELITVAVFLVLQLLDVWTTTKGLKLGATEANPAIKWVMDKVGKLWPVVKLALSLIGGYMMFYAGLLWFIWLLCLVMAWVVWNNYKVIKSLK